MKWLFGLLFGGGLFAGLRAAVLQALGYNAFCTTKRRTSSQCPMNPKMRSI